MQIRQPMGILIRQKQQQLRALGQELTIAQIVALVKIDLAEAESNATS